ncbi:MAG TPA: VOC family protein [Polyangiaceae bacterium]|nr:VOC family protein [Polyangiaceae bacterium]
MPKKSASKKKSAPKAKAPAPKPSAPKPSAMKPSAMKPSAAKAAAAKPAKASAKKVTKKAAAKKAPKQVKKVEAVPQRYGTATPHLIVSPCGEALDFYVKAFGAKLMSKMEGPDGKVAHAELQLGDSTIMFADEMPPMPGMDALLRKSPKNAGAITGGVMLYLEDVDAFVERAVAAGATVAMPVQDMFWGDRYGQLVDPFGHVWAVATHIRDMSPAEMQEAAMSAMAAMAPPAA